MIDTPRYSKAIMVMMVEDDLFLFFSGVCGCLFKNAFFDSCFSFLFFSFHRFFLIFCSVISVGCRVKIRKPPKYDRKHRAKFTKQTYNFFLTLFSQVYKSGSFDIDIDLLTLLNERI
jgi:hypothetical protein